MKCGIITFHRAYNYGGVLQAYALTNTINNMGVECEIIDYRGEFIEKLYSPFSLKNLPSAKVVASIVLKNGSFKKEHKVFRDFRNEHLRLSSTQYNNLNLNLSNEDYDVFITGSDQVWSYFTGGFEGAYFLDFVEDASKKNSYAASFGVEFIPDKYINEYKIRLKDFNLITLRENQGSNLVEELIGERHPVVLDPTLLLSSDNWLKIINENSKYKQRRYLLIYVIAESKDILALAKKIAAEKDLEIIYISNNIYKQKEMEYVSNVAVTGWLDLFYHATFIITNSFHGVAFSINFKKQFLMQLLPGNARVNSRLENILNLFDLVQRKVEKLSDTDHIENINYETIDNVLEKERAKSLKYVGKIVGKK